MQPCLKLSFAESVGEIWSALHRHLEIAISRDEVHYLRSLALALDDDLVSHLLLKKLRLARILAPADLPPDIVRMNSYFELAHDGGERGFRQLVHPAPHSPAYGLSVGSLLGAGALGLRAGQSILWPGEDGELRDLHVAHVENCPGLAGLLGQVRG